MSKETKLRVKQPEQNKVENCRCGHDASKRVGVVGVRGGQIKTLLCCEVLSCDCEDHKAQKETV